MPIKLVVGLGNPGKTYAATRHNIGRRVVEWLENEKPGGVALFMPDVFMNTSGVPVAQLMRKKGWQPHELLVISDDFELPLGSLRIRLKGSSGGHNGLKSVFENLTTQEIPRLRVGIGPVPEGEDPADFVLKTFTSSEKKLVEEAIHSAAQAVGVIVNEGLEPAMNRFNKKARADFMKVRDIMRKTVVVLPQNATLKDVLDKFLANHLDSLPIIDAAQRVVGFITIDDLVDIFLPRYYEILRDFSALEDKGQLASLFNQGFAALDTHHEKLILAADVMSSDIHWVSSDDSLLQAAAQLQSQNHARLPVIDKDRKLVGLISDFEVILALLRGTPATV